MAKLVYLNSTEHMYYIILRLRQQQLNCAPHFRRPRLGRRAREALIGQQGALEIIDLRAARLWDNLNTSETVDCCPVNFKIFGLIGERQQVNRIAPLREFARQMVDNEPVAQVNRE